MGYPGAFKYDAGWRTEPRWRECHRPLSMRAKAPDAEHRRLTQILAVTWLIGHSDLHRTNLGFLHAQDGSPPSITIAPLYDVSRARGLKNIDQTLAMGIARQLGLGGAWLAPFSAERIRILLAVGLVVVCAWVRILRGSRCGERRRGALASAVLVSVSFASAVLSPVWEAEAARMLTGIASAAR